MNEIGRMTMYEYDLLMTGVLLRKQDEDELLHRSAWLTRQVEATKSDGKTPLYKKYSDFYKKKDCFISQLFLKNLQNSFFIFILLLLLLPRNLQY